MQEMMKPFSNKKAANEFATEVNGYYEGPFIDDKLNSTYYVFWKEEDKNITMEVK